MLVNEGLASFMVDRTVQLAGGSLWGKKVGLLGMTFKADNDDIRESLSFRVKKGLEFKGAQVLCHDPFLNDTTPLEQVVASSDVFVLGTPHSRYKELKLSQPTVDVWGFFGKPTLEVLPGSWAFEEQKLRVNE